MSYVNRGACITTADIRAALEDLGLSNALEESGTPRDLIERGAILALSSLLRVVTP